MKTRGNWVVWCAWMGVWLAPAMGHSSPASIPVRVFGAQAFLGVSGKAELYALLSRRGYQLCRTDGSCRGRLLQVRFKAPKGVIIRRGKELRSFQLPSHYQEERSRARAVVTFISLFREMISSQLPMPRFRPPPEPRRKAPVAIAAKPRQPPVRKRPQPKPPARVTAKPKARPKARPRPAPKARPRPAPKAKPEPKKVALGLKRKAVPMARPSWWSELGAMGLGGIQSPSGLPVGGGLFYSLGIGRLSFHGAFSLQPLVGIPNSLALLPRFDLLAGYAVVPGWLRIELGPLFELGWIKVGGIEALYPRLGGLLGLHFSYSLSARWKLFVRPAFLFFPQSYTIRLRGTVLAELSPWRVELGLGFRYRL